MYVDRLECTSCGVIYDWQEDILLCKSCGSTLTVKYDLERIRNCLDRANLVNRATNVWRYRELLPIINEQNIVSLGEGWTPVIKAENYGKAMGLRRLFFKLEYLNPTGSLKDRGSTVLVSRVRELGVKSVADDSSGNAGLSLAAYCAKTHIECTLYVPMSAPVEKLVQASYYGAKIMKIPGSRSDVARAIQDLYEKREVNYASHNRSPFVIEGMKTFSFEIAEQTRQIPEHIIFPVGGGSLLVGARKGFEEMAELNWIKQSPSLHCVQSNACMPVVIAYEKKLRHVKPVEEKETIAGGIRITNPPRGTEILKALYDTKGSAIAVSDEDILRHQLLLAREEGIFAEPTSCAALAGLAKLCEERKIAANESVLVPITGFGLKDLKTAMKSIAYQV